MWRTLVQRVELPGPDAITSITLATCDGTPPPFAGSADKLATALKDSAPIAPDDPRLRGWHYAPWCTLTFTTPDGTYTLKAFLGGLGFLTAPSGQSMALLF